MYIYIYICCVWFCMCIVLYNIIYAYKRISNIIIYTCVYRFGSLDVRSISMGLVFSGVQTTVPGTEIQENTLMDSVPGGVAVGDDVQRCSTLFNCSSTILTDLDLNHLVPRPSLYVSIDEHWVWHGMTMTDNQGYTQPSAGKINLCVPGWCHTWA